MKTIKITFLLALLLCFTFNLSQAQQAYQVHQDNVKPSMLMEYEKIAKEFNAAKGSTEYYRVYRNGFGQMENYYMVSVSAKDEIDSAARG
ncbi:hypothetical protein N8013_06170 [Algibacter sp.]|nr:hypothetical protein [Algibacter sp.]